MVEVQHVAAGEVDTTQPFESVKAAVDHFGEIADAKSAVKFHSVEKRSSSELLHLRETLAATKAQLVAAQASRNDILAELSNTKRLVERRAAEISRAYPEAGSKLNTLPTTSDEHRGVTENRDELSEEPDTADAESSRAVGQLKQQLAAAKDSQDKLALEVAEADIKLKAAKAEAERARANESEAREAEKLLAGQLSELKSKLASLEEERNGLSASSESLRAELSRVKMQLSALNETGAECYGNGSTGAASEVQKLKAKLAAMTVAEAKAKEAAAGLSHALQLATREADNAKLAAETALEESDKAKMEAEQAKAALLTAESRLEAANREAQAAKASESMALAQLRELQERAASKSSGEQRAMEQEYQILAAKMREAEELATMRLAAALAQVDAAKASEHETMTKLEASKLEVETNKALAKQALHRAETAEAAKAAIENELRRRRKAASDAAAATAAAASPFHSSAQTPDRRTEPPLSHTMPRHSLDYGYVSADVSAESIAELLQLKVASTKSDGESDRVASDMAATSFVKQQKKNKSSFLPKIGSYLSRKKSSVNASSPR